MKALVEDLGQELRSTVERSQDLLFENNTHVEILVRQMVAALRTAATSGFRKAQACHSFSKATDDDCSKVLMDDRLKDYLTRLFSKQGIEITIEILPNQTLLSVTYHTIDMRIK
jgi:hypothetical protein